MPKSHSAQTVGIMLVIAAAFAWSTAPLFVRLLPLDSWTILFWRGVFAGCFISAYLLVVQGRRGLTDLVSMTRGGWLVAVLSTLGMIAFIPALQHTSAANVAVIGATGPFMAAGLAWIWFREAPRLRTLLASAFAVAGVAIIVGGASAAADTQGIGLTLIMALSFAAMTVAVRRYRDTSMVAAAALSNFLGSSICIPFAQGIANVSSNELALLAMFGTLQVALGLTLFVIGSRVLPAAQASLLATLEMPLMPLWIWLAFNEWPAGHQLIGGAIVLTAVVADAAGDLRPRNRRDFGAATTKPAPASENLP
jgi:drug/metabolite transporter (DMT)-like permease